MCRLVRRAIADTIEIIQWLCDGRDDVAQREVTP